MNLSEYLKVVEAGGPGSGCRGPNCGRKGSGGAKYTSSPRSGRRALDTDNRPMSKRFHNELTKSGFKFKGTAYDGLGRGHGISTYEHPKHGSISVSKDPDPGSPVEFNDVNGNMREGIAELREHLASLASGSKKR